MIAEKLDYFSAVRLSLISKKFKQIITENLGCNWRKFEFITENTGAYGPDIKELIQSYEKRFIYKNDLIAEKLKFFKRY